MCCIINSLVSDLFIFISRASASLSYKCKRRFQIDQQAQRTYSSNGKHANQRPAKLSSTNQRYKMMSKKGLLKFVKYTLIFSNAFGFILSIFLGLFGIAYSDKHFPLSYKGREMALCSLFCMLFTTIGYCGAQNHRRILLIIYGATNVIIVIIVVILWFLFRENSILGNKEISNMFITTLAITIAVMFLFSFILAFHIQTFKDNTHDSIVSQSQQLLQQTTAFLQQQQQYQQQQLQQHQVSSLQPSSAHITNHQNPKQNHNRQSVMLNKQQQRALTDNEHLSQTQMPPTTSGRAIQLLSQSSADQVFQQQQSMKQVRLDKQSIATAAALAGASGELPKIASAAGAIQLPPPHMHQAGIAMIGSPPPSPPPPPQVPNTNNPQAQQSTLMRNQSSPLPAVRIPVGAIYQSRQVQQGQQHIQHQGSRPLTGEQQYQAKQQPLNMIPPPPPSPPSMHHHYQHQYVPPRDHHQARLANTTVPGNRIPSCPVQYCTFQCDRTV